MMFFRKRQKNLPKAGASTPRRFEQLERRELLDGASLCALAGDWDGDGTTTIGYYDRADGEFLVRNANTAGFARKLAHGQWGELVQQPHPGITTQWFGAVAIRADDWAVKKLPLVAGQVLLMLAIGYVFGRLWGKWAGLLVVAVLALDPLLLAHSRVYAMDSLLSLFAILALGLLFLWQTRKREWRYLVLAGVAVAAATLSKLPGVLLVPFSVGLMK